MVFKMGQQTNLNLKSTLQLLTIILLLFLQVTQQLNSLIRLISVTKHAIHVQEMSQLVPHVKIPQIHLSSLGIPV